MADLTEIQMQRRAIFVPWLLVPTTAICLMVMGLLSGAPGNWPFAIVYYSTGFGPIYYLAPLLLFYVTGYTLLIPRERLPLSSFVLIVFVAAASAWYFRSAWSYGQEYQGPAVVLLFILVNVAVAIALSLMAFRARKRPEFSQSLWVHFSVVLWATTTAFPYFGEAL